MAAWSRRKDVHDRLAFVPSQEAPSPPMTPALAEAAKLSVLVVQPDGQVLKAGRAVLFIFDALGFGRLARFLSWRPVFYFVDRVYWLVARNRAVFSRFIFTQERDRLPPP